MLFHGAMAPSARLKFLSGITSSGSKYSFSPSPSHAGHAPYGLLNENKRGSISSIVKPLTGHANLEEKVVMSPVVAFSANIMPSAKRKAVSIESGKRWP